jgi:hypothetical protein
MLVMVVASEGNAVFSVHVAIVADCSPRGVEPAF